MHKVVGPICSFAKIIYVFGDIIINVNTAYSNAIHLYIATWVYAFKNNRSQVSCDFKTGMKRQQLWSTLWVVFNEKLSPVTTHFISSVVLCACVCACASQCTHRGYRVIFRIAFLLPSSELGRWKTDHHARIPDPLSHLDALFLEVVEPYRSKFVCLPPTLLIFRF